MVCLGLAEGSLVAGVEERLGHGMRAAVVGVDRTEAAVEDMGRSPAGLVEGEVRRWQSVSSWSKELKSEAAH